jgi:hypothetical protein
MSIMRRTSLLVVGSIVIALVLQWRDDAQQDRHTQSSARSVQHYDETLLSKPSHRVRMENDVRVTMRDGVSVSVDESNADHRPQRALPLARGAAGDPR